MSVKVEELTKEQWIRKIKRLSKDELIDLAIELDFKYDGVFERNTKMLKDIAFAKKKLLEYGYEWQPKFRSRDEG